MGEAGDFFRDLLSSLAGPWLLETRPGIQCDTGHLKGLVSKRANRRTLTFLSSGMTDVIPVVFSLVLSRSYISAGLGSGKRDQRQGVWLRVSMSGLDGR